MRTQPTVLAVGVACTVFATLPIPGRAAAAPFALADLARVVTISTPQLSPDGRSAVALISRVDTAHDRLDDDIDLIDIASGSHRTLTFERTGLAAPKWSPDGRRIAFIANAGSSQDARPQVFVLPLTGGDARRVTAAPDGVDAFAWRPDGRALAYVAVDAAPNTSEQRFVDAYEVGNGSNLLPGAARSFRVWLQPLDTSRPALLTPGAGSVTSGEAASTLSFSPDGSALAYLWAPTAILNDADYAAVRIVNVASRVTHALTTHAKHERDPLFSPNGTQIAYLYAGGDNQVYPQEAYVAPSGQGTSENVSHAVDQYVHDTAWQPAGETLYFTSVAGTHTAVWRRVPGATAQRIDIGGLCISSPLAGAVGDDGSLLYVGSATGKPPELYVSPPGQPPRKLSDYNAVVAGRTFGTSQRITYPTTTGVTGDGVLIAPPGFRPTRKYPLVLLIHGGPTDASTESFASDGFDDLAQLMAARGWLVLEPNYRGSFNLGRRYLAAIYNDVSTGPGRDIMAAVDAVRARGIVDSARIAVSGWSYGGVMTTWMIARYHIWKAAVSGAAVTDWIADYAIADDIDADVDLFAGSPFIERNRARWVHEQSITYVNAVTTPVLLMADRGDARVANVSSYEFFHALRDLGKPVTFIVYPVDGHFPRDPSRTADVYARWLRYIGDHFTP